MSIPGIEQTIIRVRDVINDEKTKNLVLNHELSTRYALIDPILRALGWNIADPRHCQLEYWQGLYDQRRAIDYALFDRNGKPKILIEAKRISFGLSGESEETQLGGYVEGFLRGVAALTNGRVWYIYSLRKRGEFSKRCVNATCPVDLVAWDSFKAAQELHKWLCKSKWW